MGRMVWIDKLKSTTRSKTHATEGDGDICKATDNFDNEEEILNRKPHKVKEESEDID